MSGLRSPIELRKPLLEQLPLVELDAIAITAKSQGRERYAPVSLWIFAQ
ncbi:MAG: hypothetical protein ACREOH_04095 [Candidatus Entotheonellia bacterium]